MKQVRTRFAVSPTGFMHVGGVRTALFAWLVAKHTNGEFVLRIEDTDKVREVEGSTAHILESLKWLGIDWSEGPDIGGDLGPYTQSERLNIYHQWAQKLVDAGRAYADPYSKEELEEFRQKAKQDKKPFLFRDFRPGKPGKWDGKQTLRLRSEPKAYSWHDEVMGDLSAGEDAVDDFVLMKSDGFPTYNFAHIIDDHLMKITHIIRSQEFTSSVPRFLNLYEALEFDKPILATVPYVMSEQGNKKLSKRDGAKDLLDYKNEGFLPEALMNFLATLGWNDGTDKEIFTKTELIEAFRLEKVQRGGARFDERKLLWLNGQYIRNLPLEQLAKNVEDFWPDSAKTKDDKYRMSVLAIVQERLKFYAELPLLTSFFFEELPFDNSLVTDDKKLKKLGHVEIADLLHKSIEELEKSDFTKPDLDKRLNGLLEQTKQKPAVLFSLIRIAITMAPSSPGLSDTLFVLGKDVSLARIKNTYAKIKR